MQILPCFPGIPAAFLSAWKTAVLSKPQTLAVRQEEVGQGPLLMSLPSIESTAEHRAADASLVAISEDLTLCSAFTQYLKVSVLFSARGMPHMIAKILMGCSHLYFEMQ